MDILPIHFNSWKKIWERLLSGLRHEFTYELLLLNIGIYTLSSLCLPYCFYFVLITDLKQWADWHDSQLADCLTNGLHLLAEPQLTTRKFLDSQLTTRNLQSCILEFLKDFLKIFTIYKKYFDVNTQELVTSIFFLMNSFYKIKYILCPWNFESKTFMDETLIASIGFQIHSALKQYYPETVKR